MEKKILFPQIGGIMHGGDYNPEQCLDRPDILEEDIRMMKKAGMNCATLGVFPGQPMSRGKGNFISHGCMTSWISYMPMAFTRYWRRRPERARHGWMKHIRSADAWIPTGCVNITGCGTTTV